MTRKSVVIMAVVGVVVLGASLVQAGGAGANWLVSVSNMSQDDVAVTCFFNTTTKGNQSKLVTIQAGKGYTFALGEGCAMKLTGAVKNAAGTKMPDLCIQSDCAKACRNTSWKIIDTDGAYTFEVF